jgi:formylglycine-generating enzyme required for sulfatase activity
VARRAFVRDAVDVFMQRYPGNRYLATCRTLSYQPPESHGAPDLRLTKFRSTFELAPLDTQKIDRFIKAWYTELACLGTVRKEDVEKLANQLQQAVYRPDLQRLAHNPLLLTVMSLVHTHKGRLPDARAMLYEETMDILLWRWEQLKAGGHEETPHLKQLMLQAGRTEVDLKRVLWKLAFEAHAQIGSEDKQDKIADIGEFKLEKALAALKSDDRNWARQVLEAMKLRAGLLIERAPELFTFPHRTFQEYFAGAYLSTQATFARDAADLAKHSELWREVILLAVGRLVNLSIDTDKPLALVGELCPSEKSEDDDTSDWRKACLAGEILLEVGLTRVGDSTLGQDLMMRVRRRMTELITEGWLPPRERTTAGRTLAKLGDPRFRPDAFWLPNDTLLGFVEIPAGTFSMGTKEEDIPALIQKFGGEKDWYKCETEQHQFDLQMFYISRYLITNAQFNVFLEDGGYKEPRYWEEAEIAKVWEEDGYIKDRWRQERRNKPYDYGEPFNLPNHPVVGVTWYEALAYTKWLTEQLRTRSGTPEHLAYLLREDKWEITLPTEIQWEKAARGEGGRIFPWEKDEINPNLANYDKTGINTTSAVGCFPGGASFYGVQDLSGNVWE